MNSSATPLSDVTTLAFIGLGEAVQAFIRRWQETSAEFGETAGNVDWHQGFAVQLRGFGLRADAILAALAEKGADNG